jgi:hypothetical protein
MKDSGKMPSMDRKKVRRQLVGALKQIAVKKMVKQLHLENEEEFYALFLSQQDHLDVLAKSTGLPVADMRRYADTAVQQLGPEAVEKINQANQELNQEDLFLGALNPENNQL